MSKQVAKIIRLARHVIAIEFPTKDAMDKYLDAHPDADKSNHRVVETQKPKAEIKSESSGGSVKKEEGSKSYPIQPIKVKRLSGVDFRKVVERCKLGNEDGASVELKDEYSDDWTMLASEDGTACIAITEDKDIVSVAKAKDSREKGWATRAVREAIKHGGRTLDCFDTVLPFMYAKAGMKVIARLPWNDEYAPAGWSYEKNEPYNHGRPDVVFMAYVGDAASTDDHVGGEMVKTYEEGKELQKLFLGVSKEIKMKASENGSGIEIAGLTTEECEEIITGLMSRFDFTREKAVEVFLNS